MLQPRRWPYITTAVIAALFLTFLFTHRRLQAEAIERAGIESLTLSLAAIYPDVPETAAQQHLIDEFRKSHSQEWEYMASRQSAPVDSEVMRVRMTGLAQRLDDFQRSSLISGLALDEPHRSVLENLAAIFLHSSWGHLGFNICFLWLVAGTLEDVWGRKMYAGIFVVCSLLGTWAYSIAYVDSVIPLIGASGLIAALMGAYLIRFPKTMIQSGTALWEVRPHLLTFSSPVYIVFPAWLLGLVFWGKSAGETTNAAYLAQTFALAMGAILGVLLWITGIETQVSQQVEAHVALAVDPHIASATEYVQRGKLDLAINAVNAQIAEKPGSVEAHEMLASLYLRKGNVVVKYLKSLEGLCGVQLKAPNPEAAWQVYEDYLKMGGRKMPADTWFQLARFAENQGDWERAVTEYVEFAQAWPDERSSVVALTSAGRIQLQKFGRAEEARRLYLAARESRAPHSDWDDVIKKGLEQVEGAAAPKAKI